MSTARAAYSVCSLPLCGGGLGRGPLNSLVFRNESKTPSRRFAPTSPTRGEVEPAAPEVLP